MRLVLKRDNYNVNPGVRARDREGQKLMEERFVPDYMPWRDGPFGGAMGRYPGPHVKPRGK